MFPLQGRVLLLGFFLLGLENQEFLEGLVLLLSKSPVYVLLPDLLFKLELELADFQEGLEKAFMMKHRSLKK